MSKSRNQKANTQRGRVRPSLVSRSKRKAQLDARSPLFAEAVRVLIVEADISPEEKSELFTNLWKHRPEIAIPILLELCARDASFIGSEIERGVIWSRTPWLDSFEALEIIDDDDRGLYRSLEVALLRWERPADLSQHQFDHARLDVIHLLLDNEGEHGEDTANLLFQMDCTHIERIEALSPVNPAGRRSALNLTLAVPVELPTDKASAVILTRLLDMAEEIIDITLDEQPMSHPEVLIKEVGARAGELRQRLVRFWDQARIHADTDAQREHAEEQLATATIMARTGGEPFHLARVRAMALRHGEPAKRSLGLGLDDFRTPRA